MKLQYASFLLPLHSVSDEQDELNRFLRGHRIVQTRKELASTEGTARWAVLVEYLDSQDKNAGEQQIKNRVDYKNNEQIAVSREQRKRKSKEQVAESKDARYSTALSGVLGYRQHGKSPDDGYRYAENKLALASVGAKMTPR
jgi:hypothetical protein